MTKYYYYTRWKFKTTPQGLDHCGPYHSTWISESNPKEFLATLQSDNLRELHFREFDTEEEMNTYWNKPVLVQYGEFFMER